MRFLSITHSHAASTTSASFLPCVAWIVLVRSLVQSPPPSRLLSSYSFLRRPYFEPASVADGTRLSINRDTGRLNLSSSARKTSTVLRLSPCETSLLGPLIPPITTATRDQIRPAFAFASASPQPCSCAHCLLRRRSTLRLI